MLLVPLDFNLEQLENVLDIIEVALLRAELVFQVLDPLAVLLVEILEGIHQVHILERYQGFLKDAEVKHLNLFNRVPGHFIRKSL